MRRFDKKKNINKANLLVESRYLESKGIISEEESYIDKNGNLKGFDDKIFYDVDKIGKFVYWWKSEYSDYANKQGWDIVFTDSEIPNEKYHSECIECNSKVPYEQIRVSHYWQIQQLSSPEEGEGLLGPITDFEAMELATKNGIMVDDFGVVIGWNNQSLL